MTVCHCRHWLVCGFLEILRGGCFGGGGEGNASTYTGHNHPAVQKSYHIRQLNKLLTLPAREASYLPPASPFSTESGSMLSLTPSLTPLAFFFPPGALRFNSPLRIFRPELKHHNSPRMALHGIYGNLCSIYARQPCNAMPGRRHFKLTYISIPLESCTV